MNKRRALGWWVWVVGVGTLVAGPAAAQDDYDWGSGGEEADPVDGTESDFPPPTGSAPPPDEPMEMAPAPSQTSEPADAMATTEPEPSDEEASWTDGFSVMLFADSYYMVDWNRPFEAGSAGAAPHRAYANSNGFALSFLGIDAAYTTDHFGATTSLRFGPSMPVFIGAPFALTDTDGDGVPDAASGSTVFGIENLKQAYGTWSPTDSVTLDFGMFDTIYGAEVAESWRNYNYTRGALYYLMQPFHHTGLRANVGLGDFSLTGMVVNGVNDVVDGNGVPQLGVQIGWGADSVSAVAGYLLALESETEAFAHFADLVVGFDAGSLGLLFNADLGVVDPGEAGDTQIFYGASLALRYAVTDAFAAAVRGEYLGDPDGWGYGVADGVNLTTGTLTLEYVPFPSVGHLILRLDNRIEIASEDIFVSGDDSEPTGTWFSTVLGVVVTSEGVDG